MSIVYLNGAFVPKAEASISVDDRGFHAVAIFGTPGIGNRLVTGPDAARALRESYRS